MCAGSGRPSDVPREALAPASRAHVRVALGGAPSGAPPVCGCYAAMEPALQAQVGQSMAAADGPRRSMRAASTPIPMWDRCLTCLGWSRRRANPDGGGTLIWAVPSLRNKDNWDCVSSPRMKQGSLPPAGRGRVGSCLETFKPSC